MAKKYYWLKLRDEFFGSLRMKKLRRIAGGDTYVIIYLKMQLMAIKNDGIIDFEGVEETFAEELASILYEEPENVEVTIAFLKSHGLIEEYENGSFFLPEAVENVGSESESAKRMRKMRKSKEDCKQLKASHCDTNVTVSNAQCNKNVTTEEEEEIEEEKEIEKDIEEEVEEKDISLFLSSYKELFISIFKREPNKSHLTAIKNLYLKGKPSDQILAILEQTRNKYIKEPEPYIYKTIQHHRPIETQTDDIDKPLEQWELDWLEEMKRYRERNYDTN